MKLSDQTIMILNNFKTIQPNVVFRKGDTIRTMAEATNIMASAKLDMEIEQEFGIYDLNEFLATLNLVDSPNLDLKEDHAVMKSTSGRSRIRYYFSEPEILTAPTKDIPQISEEVKFMLDADTLSRLKKAAATLGHEIMTVSPKDGALELSVVDPKSNTSNAYSIDVAGESTGDFNFQINLNSLKLIPVDYDVTISRSLIAHLVSRDAQVPVKYWITLEKDSVYDG